MTSEPEPPAAGSRPEPFPSVSPTNGRGWSVARLLPYVPALIPLAVTVAILVTLVSASQFHNFGWAFFGFDYGSWGIMTFVVGSFLTSVPALAISMLVGLGIAIASTTYLPRILAAWLDPFVDLLAGIPSIVYGLWGLLVIAPYFGTTIFPWSATHLSWIPGFAPAQFAPTPGIGTSLALAIIVLTLMILPITTLLMRDALKAVPRDLWESGLALGATPWEVTRRVALPYAKRGVWGAAFLGFGRAIGETVAVFMVIDQIERLPVNIYGGTSTMASLIIGTFDNALLTNSYGHTYLHYLAELAIVLLGITLLVNVAGRWFIRRTYTEVAGL